MSRNTSVDADAASNCAAESYDERFYRYIEQGSARSAVAVRAALEKVLPFPIRSVLDVGCGAGAWLTAFRSESCSVLGIDGAHVARDSLCIEASEFAEHDLAQAFVLGRRFDLVLCLEVAEHLPDSSAALLVESLCRHGDVILFSAAPPGQGGAAHINEQPYEYWRTLFAARGYRMYDTVRRAIADLHEVSYWYRYNAFLFVNGSALPELHERLAADALAPGVPVPDVAPWLFRLRRRLIGLLPVPLVSWLADLRKNMLTTGAR